MSKRILYVYGEESSGVTFVTANLAHALKNHTKILAVDLHLGARQLPSAMGISDFVVYDLYDYQLGICDERKVVIDVAENLGLIAAPYKASKAEFSPEALMEIIEKVDCDIVLLDGSHLPKPERDKLAGHWSEVLLVTKPGVYIEDPVLLKKKYWVIENRLPEPSPHAPDLPNPGLYLGSLLEEGRIERAQKEGQLFYPQDAIGERFKELAEILYKNELKPVKKGFFAWLKGLFQRKKS